MKEKRLKEENYYISYEELKRVLDVCIENQDGSYLVNHKFSLYPDENVKKTIRKKRDLKVFSDSKLIFEVPETVLRIHNPDIIDQRSSFYGIYKIERDENVFRFIISLCELHDYIMYTETSSEHIRNVLFNISKNEMPDDNLINWACSGISIVIKKRFKTINLNVRYYK